MLMEQRREKSGQNFHSAVHWYNWLGDVSKEEDPHSIVPVV